MSTINILIGATGSVATIKIPEIIQRLRQLDVNVNVRLVPTEHARHFLPSSPDDIGADEVFSDDQEWSSWQKRGDQVLHIELRKWADIFVIAPLDANSLGKCPGPLENVPLKIPIRRLR